MNTGTVSKFKPLQALTFSTVMTERKRLLKHMQSLVIGHFYLDLSNVTLCDSAGLALLIEARRLCDQYQKKMVLENISEEIYALAKFCGVEEVL